ncbi:hypothetical protein SMMN14_09577 [Sphaerulina musiva]
MRSPTIILCWYTSTFLSLHLTSAAPGGREGVAVAIDFGAVTEKFPLPDASQQQQVVATTKTLQREQKISKSQPPEPVRLWIDDFGNIEAVPIVEKAGLDDDDSSSSSSSTEKSAPGSSNINQQQPPPSQPPNPQKKNHHLAPPAPAPAPAPAPRQQQQQRQQQRQLQDRTTERALINWKWPSNFSSELSGILYFTFGGILLLGGLITLALGLSTRRRNIRILGMGHRRGRSRFSL